MAIKIYRTPQRRDDKVEVSANGETLIVNGASFNLSNVNDPTEIDCPFIIGPVFRMEGDVHVCVVEAYGADVAPLEPDEMPSIMAVVPEPVPAEISDRQFFHILAVDGLITESEALAAVKTGDAPSAFEALISSLPDGDRFDARMLLEGATTFRRDHPLTDAFGNMYGMTPEQIDDLWRRASEL